MKESVGIRRTELDALRGLMLVMMTITHLPTRYAAWIGQPFGFVSAAEGFVFLSAFLVGLVYARRAVEQGPGAMCRGLLRRAGVVYACHAAMLFFLFTVMAEIARVADRLAVENLLSFYFEQPGLALAAAFSLLYNPPLHDILPMYVLFMLASPLLLAAYVRGRRWPLVLSASVLLWLLAQLGAGRALYEALANAASLGMPYRQTGAFGLLAWQIVWVFGLWLGASLALRGRLPFRRFPGWVIALALFIGFGGLAWRHIIGQAPFGGHAELNALFDKWQLGPLRLVDFLALFALAVRFGPRFAPLLHLRFLETLGRASLPVFAVHVALVLLALAAFGDRTEPLPLALETLLVASALALLYAVALLVVRHRRLDVRPDGPAPELVARAVEVKGVGAEKLPARQSIRP